MHSHQPLTKPDSSPGLVTSFPPQHIQVSPQTEPTSESGERDLKAERERAERLGHHFSRVKVLSDRPPIDPVQQFQLSIQKQVTSQQDPQAEAEEQSSLSEQEKMTLISVLQEIREVSLPAADFVSGAVYQWLHNNGETGRWLLQATSPEWREMDQQAEAALPDSEAFELGRAWGDGASVITGLAEMSKGGGAIAGGGTLCVAGAAPTAGGSCLAGGAAVAVGAALVVHGAGTTTAGVQGLAERLGIFFSKGTPDDLDREEWGEGPEAEAINVTSNYRAGLSRKPRHHILPQEHRRFFEKRGFVNENDIDNFTVELPEADHQAYHGGGNWRLGRTWDGEWNRRIMKDIQEAEAGVGRQLGKEEVLDVAQDLMEEYGIDAPFVPYRGK